MYKAHSASSIDQGVIVSGVYYYHVDATWSGLVLTPTCDFEQNKVDFVQVCPLIPLDKLIRLLRADRWSGYNKSALRDNLAKLITQKLPRYHLLAPWSGADVALVADFQGVASYDVKELMHFPVVAELESPFREQVPARYVAYMGRVGTPDMAEEDHKRWLDIGMQVVEDHDRSSISP